MENVGRNETFGDGWKGRTIEGGGREGEREDNEEEEGGIKGIDHPGRADGGSGIVGKKEGGENKQSYSGEDEKEGV